MPVCSSNEIQVLQLLQNSIEVKGPFTTELLSGGCSGSEVIKVNTSDKSYVIRFWNMQWADYFPQDLACQLIASDAGYGPKVYFSDAVKGITIMDYYSPEALPEIRLQPLVDLIKKIHSGPAVPKGIDRAVYLDLLIEELKQTQFFDLEAIRTIKETVFAATRPNSTCVACHRDLHHGNLIYKKGNFLAIDYTWGAMDDPYTDLANIAIFNCKTEEEERSLLQLYFGHVPSAKEMARLSLMKLPAKIFYGLEFLGIANSSGIDGSVIPQASKAYMNFGPPAASNSTDFLSYAFSLLTEVMDYSRNEKYLRDLTEILKKKF